MRQDFLLGSAIENSLRANAESRPDTTILKKQLDWSADEKLSKYLLPRKLSWTDWRGAICRFPWLFMFPIVFGVSLFATWYVIEYNATESVLRSEDQQLFLEARRMINRIVYPLGFVFLLGLFWKTWLVLRNPKAPVGACRDAIENNLSFGHTAAMLFAIIWTISGTLFPIVLSAKGADLPVKAWLDFPLSHLTAGLICGAFVFFGLTLLSVVAWHPKLVMTALNQGAIVDVENSVSQIRTRMYWYRVVAIGAPLVAIATLVNFRTENNFAVSCLSIAAIIGLAMMARAIRDITKALELLDRC